MRFFFVIVLFLVSICLSSCLTDHNKSISQKKFGVSNEEELISSLGDLTIAGNPDTIIVPDYSPNDMLLSTIDSLYQSIEIVRLETNPDCIVGYIDQLEIKNDTIYILDKESNSIFLFTISGKFVTKIMNVGGGPGEYSAITSMSVGDDCIFVYDEWTKKVIAYSHDGDLVSEHILKFFCQNVLPLSSGDYLCYGRGRDNHHLPSILDYCFWQCDSSFSEITRRGLGAEHDKAFICADPEIHTYDGRTFHFNNMDNNFYEILPNGDIRHLYHMKYATEIDERFFSDREYRHKAMTEGSAFQIINIFLANGNFVYKLSGNGFPAAFVFHNIKDNKTICLNSTNMNQSGMSRLIEVNRPYTVHKGDVVFAVSPCDILSFVNFYAGHIDLWAGAPDHVREFDKKLLESLHDEDNDILVFAKLKEHFD